MTIDEVAHQISENLTKCYCPGGYLKMSKRVSTSLRDGGLAKAVRDQTLRDGQQVGSALLWAEAKLGELLNQIPNKPASSARGTRSLPEGVTKKQSHLAQQLAEHKDLIKEVKDGAT